MTPEQLQAEVKRFTTIGQLTSIIHAQQALLAEAREALEATLCKLDEGTNEAQVLSKLKAATGGDVKCS